MDNQFLDEYIHLEKLCNEIYATNHGISRYIEDMEQTNRVIQAKIHLWTSTYKKLKELRWKRNQLVHEGNVEYDDADIVWLRWFYQQIMDAKDPLSVKYQLLQQQINSNMPVNRRENVAFESTRKTDNFWTERKILIIVSVIILIIVGVKMLL